MRSRSDDNPWRPGNVLLSLFVFAVVCAFYACDQAFAVEVSR